MCVDDIKKRFGDHHLEGWLALQRLWSPTGDDQETSARAIDGYIDVQSRGNFATSYPDNHLCEAEMETGPSLPGPIASIPFRKLEIADTSDRMIF